MKANTMLETIRSLLGMPTCAIPLSYCKPAKGYLLERAGIPDCGTAILFAIPYVMTEDILNPARNVSLYAVPRDYHGYVHGLTETILPILSQSFPAYRFALFSDHSPICEVDAAARAGLGVLGLHGLLITPTYGSFVFLGEIVTDADYMAVTGEPVPCFPSAPPLCEGCGACLAACPAGCNHASRDGCLSALTQKKGELSQEEMMAIRQGGLVWGCDTCQLACPYNRRVIRKKADTPIPYFREQRLIHVDADILDALNDKDFHERAYAWRGRTVIRRNTALLDPSEERRRS